ncbi:MAG: phage portal protein [Frankiaceae bacterium]
MLISGGQVSPLSLSDATPMSANRNYYPTSGVALSKAFATYGQVYKSQVWVSTLVNKLAFGVARLPLKVYLRAADGNRQEARDTPYAQLLRNPNSRHDPFFFWLWTSSTFEVYGEAMWVKQRPAPGRPPTALYPLHPSNVYTRRADKGETLTSGYGVAAGDLIYSYHAGNANTPIMEWTQDDVVHFKGYNPENQIRGMSRLEPLRQTILNEDAARRASQAFWANGGRPSMTITHPNNLSQQAQDRLKGNLNALHAGVDNWGKIALLEEGMTPTPMPLNAEEMQYIESRKINREEACGIYDVPPPVVHILDRATFSNITEQMRSMYRDTMAPRLGLFESVLDTQLRPDFDPQDRIYAEFLMDEVMRGAFEERAVANQSAINSGQRTPNEIRRLDNLPPLAGGDQLYINAASIPLAAASTGLPTGSDIVEHPQAIKSQLLRASTVDRLMGRLGRVGTLADVDPKSLTSGLADEAEPVIALLEDARNTGMDVKALREAIRDLQEPADPMLEVAKSLALLAAKEQPAPVVHNHLPSMTVGDVIVQAPEPKAITRRFERDDNGDITRMVEE